jgi:hypothetical protein
MSEFDVTSCKFELRRFHSRDVAFGGRGGRVVREREVLLDRRLSLSMGFGGLIVPGERIGLPSGS